MAHRIIEAMLQVFIVETPGRSNHEKMLTPSHSSTFGHPDTLSDTGRIEPLEICYYTPTLRPFGDPGLAEGVDRFKEIVNERDLYINNN